MDIITEMNEWYQNAIRYGTLIFRLDNEQTNNRLDILEYDGEIRYCNLFEGKITDVDVIGPTSAVGYVVQFDRNGNFGRGYVSQNK